MRRSTKERFETMGLTYFYTLIDDAVALCHPPEGGLSGLQELRRRRDERNGLHCLRFLLGNDDLGPGLPDGKYGEAEPPTAPHRHYFTTTPGESTSTNPMATSSSPPPPRGELDCLVELREFADQLEAATPWPPSRGTMTADPAGLWEGRPLPTRWTAGPSWRPSRRSWTSGAKSTTRKSGQARPMAAPARCYGRTQSSSTSSRRSWA